MDEQKADDQSKQHWERNEQTRKTDSECDSDASEQTVLDNIQVSGLENGSEARMEINSEISLQKVNDPVKENVEIASQSSTFTESYDIQSTQVENVCESDVETSMKSSCSSEGDDSKITRAGSFCELEKVCLRVSGKGEKACDEKSQSRDKRKNSEVEELQRLSASSLIGDDSVVEFSLEDGMEIGDTEERESEFNQTETKPENSSMEISMCKHSRPTALLQCDEIDTLSFQSVPEDSRNSSYLLSEIENLLTTTASACSPDSGFEISKVDFYSAPKENLMKMLSSLLDECDTLKKEKAR